MNLTTPLTSEEIVSTQIPLQTSQSDGIFNESDLYNSSDYFLDKLSSKQRLYISFMKPGRISFWLAINNSFIKAIVHYFAFIVFPVLVSVYLSLMSYEVSVQYKRHSIFTKSSWLTILIPLSFVLAIPTLVVIYRFVNALVHIRTYPRHLMHAQSGRLCFFLGLCLTFIQHFCIATEMGSLNPTLAILPIVIGYVFSLPLLYSRIHGLTVFVRKWHEHLSDENHDRLLVWKANMLKGQIIAEGVGYTLLTGLFISVNEICFRESYPIPFSRFLLLTAPLLFLILGIIVLVIGTFPILFSFMPPFRKYWKKHFGEVDISLSGRICEGIARFILFLTLESILVIAVLLELALWEGLCKRDFGVCATLLNASTITSLVIAVLMFVLLVIRLEIGSLTSEDVFKQIADREVGNRDWREMIGHLPKYVVQTESDVYSSLPDFVSLSKDIEEIPIRQKEEQLCLICMSELSNSVFLPCGHGGCCHKCAKVLYKQVSKRICPLCRQTIHEVAKIQTHTSKLYNNYYVFSVDRSD